MRVLMLAAASSVHAVRWAAAFAERGHETHLVTQHPPRSSFAHPVTLHIMPHLAGAGYLLNGARVAAIVRSIRPDVVNAHYATGYGTLARALRGVPVVLNVWGSDVYDFPGKSAFHRWWLRRNLSAPHRLVSTSEVMADVTHALVPGRPRPAVVPFGVDTSFFAPETDGSPSRPGPVVIGTVKTLAAKYGIDVLIKAFARLEQVKGLPPVRLRIVGGGPERAALEVLVRDLGIQERVEFTGPVPHQRVPEMLRSLDVFVALSRDDSESFGVAVIEASACALPVVVSDAGGLPEVVLDGGTGIVVRRDDPVAAAEALVRLVNSHDLRRHFGSAGRAHVQARYEWARCVDRMDNVLHEAVHTFRRP